MTVTRKAASRPAPVKPINPPRAMDAALHDEQVLDGALEDTFPASDPVAELESHAGLGAGEMVREALLDDALEFTFPASDPLSVSSGYPRIKSAPDLAPANVDHQVNPMPAKTH